MSENTANIVALIGATGQGKSATFKGWLKENAPNRLMLWDVMDEYTELDGFGMKRCATLEELVNATQGDNFRLRYVPKGDREAMWKKFEVFCRLAFARGSLTLGVEELNTVTAPGGGTPAWSDCTLRGRHKSLVIVGLSQRPALVDKNFFSNATHIRVFRLNFEDDVATMAGVLGVDKDRIRELRPLQYLERDMQSGEVTPGGLFGTPAPGGAAPAEAPAAPHPGVTAERRRAPRAPQRKKKSVGHKPKRR